MSQKNVLTRLMMMFHELSDEDLEHLERLLRNPRAAAALHNVVRSSLCLRRLEQSDRSEVVASPRPGVQQAGRLELDIRATGPRVRTQGKADLQDVLRRVLMDKNIFPTTRAAVDGVNSTLGLGLDQSRYARYGRRTLVTKCWSEIRRWPQAKQRDLIQRFVEEFAGSRSYARQYLDLFKALTRDE